jgi:hypothetical protein
LGDQRQTSKSSGGFKVAETLGRKRWQWGIVADGGYREFLGVEELIARRCRIIVVSDAGCNNGLYEFGVLADLIRQMRLDHHVEILDLDHDLPLDTARLEHRRDVQGERDEERHIQHFIIGRIRYPEAEPGEHLYDRTGLFVYVQMSLTGDEDVDLIQFQKINPRFPNEPTTNQFYDTEQVESLRQLGEHVGRHLCQRLSSSFIEGRSIIQRPSDSGDIASPSNGDITRVIHGRRIENIADALISAYLMECRQEQIVAKDETPPDWPANLGAIDEVAIAAFRDFECHAERGHLLARFATRIIEGYSRNERFNQDDLSELLPEIRVQDLAGLAVECNRRLVGFRSENPERYFRIGGRRLLLRATSTAIHLLDSNTKTDDPSSANALTRIVDIRSSLRGVSQLAVLIPRGVFRHHGIQTASDVILCALRWLSHQFENNNCHDKFCSRIDGLLTQHVFRVGLRDAIKTELANEVHDYLKKAIDQHDFGGPSGGDSRAESLRPVHPLSSTDDKSPKRRRH